MSMAIQIQKRLRPFGKEAMPDHDPDATADPKRFREAVDGYLELDLPDMAEEEIQALPVSMANHAVVLEARLAVQMHRKQWPAAVETGLTGCASAPGRTGFFIHTAFCLHELGRTEEAHLLLLSGPVALRREPLFHYNMGCYLTVLGHPKEAADHLGEAFRMDDSLRRFARSDRDLMELWPGM